MESPTEDPKLIHSVKEGAESGMSKESITDVTLQGLTIAETMIKLFGCEIPVVGDVLAGVGLYRDINKGMHAIDEIDGWLRDPP